MLRYYPFVHGSHQLGGYTYSWRPEVFPLPIWDKLEIKLEKSKLNMNKRLQYFAPLLQFSLLTNSVIAAAISLDFWRDKKEILVGRVEIEKRVGTGRRGG